MGKRAGRRSQERKEIADKLQNFRSLAHQNPEGNKITSPVTPRKTLELAASKIEGGRWSFVEYVRMGADSSPEVSKFIDLWDSQTQYAQEKKTLDEFANLAGVRAESLVSAAASAAYRYNADISDMMAMTAMPSVVKAGIKSAKGFSKTSHKDREMLYKHASFIPVPSGSVINISNSNAAVAQANSQSGLAPFSDSVNSLSESVRDAWVPPSEDAE